MRTRGSKISSPPPINLSLSQLPPELAAQFPGTAPLMSDAQNGGYIHAPSIPHADAAAVLRGGFIAAQADGDNSGELSVNLSSDRVRVALTLIEGIRNGQSLGALLGYQFELGLHDDSQLSPKWTNSSIRCASSFRWLPMRWRPPRPSPNVPIEAIEARNVLDGKKLVDQITKSGITAYPWGVDGLPPAIAERAGGARRRGELRCAMPTTPSPTWRSPKASTKQCRATTTALPAPLPLTPPVISLPSRQSSTPRRPASD